LSNEKRRTRDARSSQPVTRYSRRDVWLSAADSGTRSRTALFYPFRLRPSTRQHVAYRALSAEGLVGPRRR